jgi:hypothetical protein
VQRAAPDNTNNNVPKKKAEPRKKKPPPVKAVVAGTNAASRCWKLSRSRIRPVKIEKFGCILFLKWSVFQIFKIHVF